MILVDRPQWPGHGRLWSHLVSDTDVEELHDFAERLGMSRRAFDGDHYDVVEERYEAVLAAGAREVRSRDIVVALRAAGLRRRKRSRLAPPAP